MKLQPKFYGNDADALTFHQLKKMHGSTHIWVTKKAHEYNTKESQ